MDEFKPFRLPEALPFQLKNNGANLQYGDGYKQLVKTSIGAPLATYTVTWRGLFNDEFYSLYDFLKAHINERFTWEIMGKTYTLTCRECVGRYAYVSEITATLEEVRPVQ